MLRSFKKPALPILGVSIAAVGFGWSAAGLAQTNLSPARPAASNSLVVGGGYASSTIDYDQESGRTFELERTALFADVAYGVASAVDVFAELALINKTKVENYDEDGSGLGLGFGMRAMPYQNGPMRFGLLASYSYTNEEIKNGDSKLELKMSELRVGPSLSYALSGKFIPYVSLMMTLMGDGEMKSKIAGVSTKREYERDDKMTLEFGGDVPLSSLAIHFGAVLIGEKTFVIGLHGAI